MLLSTYPGQSGINPFPMSWGDKDWQKRGPVVVSRSSNTVRRRNGMSFFKINAYDTPADPDKLSEVCFQPATFPETSDLSFSDSSWRFLLYLLCSCGRQQRN